MAKRVQRRVQANSHPHPVGTPKKIVVGISGASGAQYATRVIEELLKRGHHVHLVVTEYGRQLLHDELGITKLTLDQLVPSLASQAKQIENIRL
jgi:3-polyprenyl-4-hydroxybenzoate decarboxylase